MGYAWVPNYLAKAKEQAEGGAVMGVSSEAVNVAAEALKEADKRFGEMMSKLGLA